MSFDEKIPFRNKEHKERTHENGKFLLDIKAVLVIFIALAGAVGFALALRDT